MYHTHYCHGSCDLVFPPGQSRVIAGALFQNYKRSIKRNFKRVEQKIHSIKQQFLDKTTLLSVFEANPYLGELIACIEQADNMRRPRRKQHDPSTKMMMSMIVRLKAQFIMKMRFQPISADK